MFLLGILAAMGAVVLETGSLIFISPFANLESLNTLGVAMLFAIFIEEFLKYALLWKVFTKKIISVNLISGSLLFGSGFALTEIFLNTLKFSSLSSSLLSAYGGLFLIHISTSIIFFWYFSSKKNPSFLAGLLIFPLPFIIHWLYNTAVFYNFNRPITYLILSAIIAFFLLLARKKDLAFSNLPNKEK